MHSGYFQYTGENLEKTYEGGMKRQVLNPAGNKATRAIFALEEAYTLRLDQTRLDYFSCKGTTMVI